MGNRGWAATGATATMAGLALLLTACGSSGSNTNAGAAYSGSGMGASPSSSAMAGPTATLTIKATSIGQVLTNARGDTLYWYAKDTKDGPSTCTGSCASAWPMVAGQAVAASGVKLAGQLGTVTDAGGARQATYNGYPLYTYAGDKTPGQTTGNGGLWHVISGSALTAASMSSTPATRAVTSAGGYSYGSGTAVTSSGSSSSGGSPLGPAAPGRVLKAVSRAVSSSGNSRARASVSQARASRANSPREPGWRTSSACRLVIKSCSSGLSIPVAVTLPGPCPDSLQFFWMQIATRGAQGTAKPPGPFDQAVNAPGDRTPRTPSGSRPCRSAHPGPAGP